MNSKPMPITYPFATRRQIATRIDTEPEFARECALVLQARTVERLAGKAPSGKAWGWMSSERVIAGKLVAAVEAGTLTDADEIKLRTFVRRYSRQVAEHSRGLVLREHPELAEAAARFGVLPTATAAPPPKPGAGRANPTEEPPVAGPAPPEPTAVPEPEPPDDRPARLLVFLRHSAGERAEAIAKALDTTTAMLGPVLREMVQGKTLQKRGVGRGTRYFVR
jgi:hypothetical protein